MLAELQASFTLALRPPVRWKLATVHASVRAKDDAPEVINSVTVTPSSHHSWTT